MTIEWNQMPPGIVFGLKHSTNQKNKTFRWEHIIYDPVAAWNERETRRDLRPQGFYPWNGGDLNGGAGEGYYWFETNNIGFQFPQGDLHAWANKFPPGLVFGLKHSRNQNQKTFVWMQGMDAFERRLVHYDPASPNGAPQGFSLQHGGDINGGAGEGFYWYESQGQGYSNWKMPLPSGLVFCLKHSTNQREKRFTWDNRSWDPVEAWNRRDKPEEVKDYCPIGFSPRHGGDLGGEADEGYYWFETTELVDEFSHLSSKRGEHKSAVVIFWDPQRPNHPAPLRATVENAITGNTNSLTQFFNEASLGRFSFEIEAFLPPPGPGNPDWYPANRPAAHYWGPEDPTDQDGDGFTSGHTEKWAEAVWKASDDFDFREYDYNNNGTLDSDELLVCMLIPENGLSGFQRKPSGQQFPSKKPLKSHGVDSGVVIPTILEVYLGAPNAGFLFHEFSHLLVDAKDVYHGWPPDSEYVPFNAGSFSVMGTGTPANLDPFHRLKYDWLRYHVALRSGNYSLRAAVPHGDALVLMDFSHSNKEYFIIENRWNTNNSCDANLPDQGLAVWHVIEDSAIFNASPTPTGTSSAYWDSTVNEWNRRGVRLIRPVFGPPQNNDNVALWDGNQPATGYDLLSDDPNPQHSELRWVGGISSEFAVRNISGAGPVINFDLEVPWNQ